MSLLFNMLPRFVIALLLRSKCLFKCPYIMRLLFKPSVFYDVAPAAKGRVPLTTASRNRSPSPLLGICWHMPWSEDPSLLLKGMIFSRTHSLHCQSARSGLVTALEWSKPWPSTRAFLWSPQKWWEGNPAAGRSRWKSHLLTVFSDHSSYKKHITTVSQGGKLGPAPAFLTTGGGERRATVLLCVYLVHYSHCLKGFYIFSKLCPLDWGKTFSSFFLSSLCMMPFLGASFITLKYWIYLTF